MTSPTASLTTMLTEDQREPGWLMDELTAHARVAQVPVLVHLDVTYRCDLRCVHCYLEDRRRPELTIAEMGELMDQLAEMGTFNLQLSGGDVFVRPDAMEILRAASERRFAISLYTHGGHITEEMARELGELSIAEVRISVYSSQPQVHDAITQVPGSLMKTLRAIRWLRDAGVRVFLQGVLMRDNPHAIMELPMLAAKYDCEYGITHTIFAAWDTHIEADRPPRARGDLLGAPGVCTGPNDLRQLNLELTERARIERLANPDVRTLEDLETFHPSQSVCGAGRSMAYVDPGGEVFTCAQWEESAGNVRDTDFATLWREGEVFQKARGLHRGDFDGCRSCGNFSFCDLCPGLAYRESGRAHGVAPTSCGKSAARRLAVEDPEHVTWS